MCVVWQALGRMSLCNCEVLWPGEWLGKTKECDHGNPNTGSKTLIIKQENPKNLFIKLMPILSDWVLPGTAIPVLMHGVWIVSTFGSLWIGLLFSLQVLSKMLRLSSHSNWFCCLSMFGFGQWWFTDIMVFMVFCDLKLLFYLTSLVILSYTK